MALTPEQWEESKEEVSQYTTAQQLDYIKYKKFLNTDEGRGWPSPASIADFLANIDKWAAQMTAQIEEKAQEEAEVKAQEETQRQEEQQVEYDARQAEYDARQAEQDARAAYARQEAYREQPMYSETFSQWIQGQSDTSQALQAYIKGQYPSLQAEFRAEAGRLTGFPTREEARTEAERRESGWQSWLGERMPETTQEYYAQRPTERGERLWMQAPTLRTVNW